MSDQKQVVAIIPARGGSKGLPRKNILPLLGKPLIAWAVDDARSCSLIDRVIVTTDDEEIGGCAKKYGAEVPFLRPADLAQDLTSTEATLQHAILSLDKTGWKADIVVFLTCTAPFRDRQWIANVVQKLIDEPEIDSAFVALKTQKNYWRASDEQSWARLAADIGYGSRQNKEPLFREETPTACATRAEIVRAGKRLGPRVYLEIVEDDRVMIDIHSEYDYWLAQQVAEHWPMSKELP